MKTCYKNLFVRAASPAILSVRLSICIGFFLSWPAIADSAVFNCISGDVACLIEVIKAANVNAGPDTINLEAGVYSLKAAAETNDDGPNGLPSITTEITIVGKGPTSTVIERDPTLGQFFHEFRIVHVGQSGNLSLSDLTIKGGGVLGPDVAGGPGVFNRGTTAITNSIIEENVADFNAGGGILNIAGTVTVANSIIAGNLVFNGGTGGGIANFAGKLTVTNSTIANNTGDENLGGGIANRGGFVTIRDSSVIGNNTAGSGGGIANDANGTMLIVNSTIGENVAGRGGGGGISNAEGTISIVNSTIAGNVLGRFAEEEFNVGGIINHFSLGTIQLRNSIIAGNTGLIDPEFPVPSAPDCGGSITSLGNNLIGDPTNCNVNLLASDLTGDPGLGDLADDGKPGRGHFPLLTSSRAINAGNDSSCPTTDQLGSPRVGGCDIGAIEFPSQPVPGLVNNLVSFVPFNSSFKTMNNTAGCPTGFVGKFSFEARLTNTTKSVTLSDLTLRVRTLTNGNLLENADGGIGGVGAALAIAKAGSFSDGLLVTGEFVDQPITICLKNKKQFSFFVDVRGIQSGNVTAAMAQR